jgi:hypothetical protein
MEVVELLCRYWIWVGIAFNVCFFFVCTQLSAVALHVLHPPKQRAILKSKERIKADLECAPLAHWLMTRCLRGHPARRA